MNGNTIAGFKRDIASSLRQASKEGITREKSIDVADKLVHKWKIKMEENKKYVEAILLSFYLLIIIFGAVLTLVNIIYADIILDKIMICNIEVEGETDLAFLNNSYLSGRVSMEIPCSEITKAMENQR